MKLPIGTSLNSRIELKFGLLTELGLGMQSHKNFEQVNLLCPKGSIMEELC